MAGPRFRRGRIDKLSSSPFRSQSWKHTERYCSSSAVSWLGFYTTGSGCRLWMRVNTLRFPLEDVDTPCGFSAERYARNALSREPALLS